MSGGNQILKVNTDVVRDVGTAFGKAGDGLAGVRADAPLGDAAGAVAQLQTGEACRKAQADVAAEMTALAERARKYGANLATAAQRYQARDRASGDAIKTIAFPK
jgi:hypothetical protein